VTLAVSTTLNGSDPVLTAPIHHSLDLTGQNILTIASWVLTVALLGVAVEMGRRERTPLYAVIVLASMVGAFAESLYDEGFMLYFYSTHGMQTFYTAFGVPQPVWTHSGYAILYAAPAMYFVHKIRQGSFSARALYYGAGVVLLMSCVFEIAGINMGTYTYWGPHVLRIAHYPIVIGILESAQVVCFSIAAAQLAQRARSHIDLLAMFPLFPVTFFGANFGAGAAVIIGIHAEHTNKAIVYLTTLASIACAGVLIRMAASFLPTAAARAEAAPSPTPAARRVVAPV
jgi:hypothetical protein